jgi:hypothetical protein
MSRMPKETRNYVESITGQLIMAFAGTPAMHGSQTNTRPA